MKLPELPDLPVRPELARITATLADRGVAVLVAPPGTGKTTLVPLALAAESAGRIVVAEPRRLAARAAAARMAALLGERVGETVGYAVRGDRKVGARTRIEVVTSGLLVRRLQSDPELAGVATVVLDECHERHLDADLLLALLLDARSGLRPDLRVLATSATVAADRLAQLLVAGESGTGAAAGRDGSGAPDVVGGDGDGLGGDPAARRRGPRAPVLEVRGRTYPVEVDYLPALPRERIEAQVARATRVALATIDGDVLVFLPGVGEINRTAGLLRDLDGVDVVPLHGRLAGAAQDLALRPGSRRRVVLSTAVAESSLTVPGVRAVVDSGLSRVSRVDHRRGLSGLATVRVSAAVAEQRAGRAGREAPGHAWRCWPEYEHQTLPAYPEPEIRTAELTRLALELACWGTPDGTGLAWWDAPPEGGLAAARTVLRALGALDEADHITPRGKAMAALGLHPRLARALLDGTARVGAKAAAEMVVLMDDDSLADTVDAAAALRALRAEQPTRWVREVQRLTRLVTNLSPGEEPDRPGADGPRDGVAPEPGRRDRSGSAGPQTDVPHGVGPRTVSGSAHGQPGGRDRGVGQVGNESGGSGTDVAALLIALAQPERLARRRSNGSSTYLLAGGTAVTVPPGSGLAAAEWLAVAVADRDPGRAEGRIRLAAIADEDLARAAAPGLVVAADEVRWDGGDVVARRVMRLGAIMLSAKPLRQPAPALMEQAVRQGLRAEGLGLLRWSDDARNLRRRLDFLHRTLGTPWPAVDDDTLLADLDTWLGPELCTARSRSDLARVDAGTALRRLLPWPDATRLDELAPERLEVPSGSRVRLDYSADQPILAVKVQEIFGWTDPPTLADGRAPLLLHLLSPAQRPVAVTADLASFWKTGWPQVRADLRGRYPKHAWPEDPTTISAHRGTARRATNRPN
ncbi:ATP-dependent RNA helicase [Nocardia alba]|uniref:ATP-dependent helicase HrpB n=1 Tax=Nocardia alba TaxID=225051 RepID=A0A4R1FJI7_9NOCA|nr:ATP-dependent helicase C-terminal domain-containing protein [Nocardia alba]TCJ94180.1 ATP-dependent helicase HrpB [Nocardia alba]